MESEHDDRLDLVEQLLKEFDDRLDEDEPVDAAMLDDIRYHLDWIQAVAGEPSFDWLWAQYLGVGWHRCRARMLHDVEEIDAALVAMRRVLEYADTPSFRLDLVELIHIRYASTETDGRPYLAEAVRELRELAEWELEDAERGTVHSLLGQSLREEFRREQAEGGNPAPELLDEAENYLDGSLDLIGPDAEHVRIDTMLDLARLRSFRSGMEGTPYVRDRDAEEEEAMALYEPVASVIPIAAFELAEMWAVRFHSSGDLHARNEALRWLEKIERDTRTYERPPEFVARRGELLLDRARRDPAELPALIDYLTEAFAAEPVHGAIGMALMEAHWLMGDAEGVITVADRLAEATDGTDLPPLNAVLPFRAVALASLALRGRAEPEEAEQLLRTVAREMSGLDWTRQLVIALIVVVRDGAAAEALAAAVLTVGDPRDVARALMARLRQHERRDPDWLCAVAVLSFRLADDLDSRVAALEATVAARAGLAESDPLDLDLLVQQALLSTSVGERNGDHRLIVAAAALMDEYFGRSDESHPLRNLTLGLYGVVMAQAHLRGRAAVPCRNAVAALTTASADTSNDPELRSTLFVELARAQMLQIYQERVDLYASAIGHCQQAMRLVAEGSEEHDEAWYLLGSVLLSRFHDHGERHDFEAGTGQLRALRESKVARGLDVTELDEVLSRLDIVLTGGATAAVGLTVAEVYARLGQLESSGMDPVSLAGERVLLAQALITYANTSGDQSMLADGLDLLASVVDNVEEGSATYSVGMVAATYGLASAAVLRRDKPKFLSAIARLEAIRADQAVPAAERASAVFGLAMLWNAQHLVSRSTADLDEALRHYAQADPSPLVGRDATGMLDGLADSCWKLASLGYSRHAMTIGFDSLRQRARDVLLQSTGEHAATRAADAAVRGQRVALRCAASGEPVRALEAVEWGRGLVLHSATLTSGIGARLRAAGHAGLAEEWAREPEPVAAGTGEIGFAPSDLRRRVLSVLGNDMELLTPPSVEDIAGALKVLDADVLVHLIPGHGDHMGRALLTTAQGVVREVLLPLLLDGPDSQAGRYLVMNDQQRRKALPSLCAWAWRAVVEPLLHNVGGDQPWLVMVPTGALGVVPWHAAAGAGRTAVREAGFTYAASARQLCDLAHRARQPVGGTPVVVSNPAGTLAAAQYEAEFLHSLYPHGRFYGHAGPGVPVHGAGTPDEVLAESGASLRHLGCHARAGASPARSVLELARADLSVERMLRHAAARDDDAPGGLVVLAACESDLTASLHDEALTLASACVAAGATGVVGTKWKVEDIESALLMCVFYDFLARGAMRPRDALRAAQLWALDHDRVVPDGIARHLSERGRAPSLADPVYWAAFAHHGW